MVDAVMDTDRSAITRSDQAQTSSVTSKHDFEPGRKVITNLKFQVSSRRSENSNNVKESKVVMNGEFGGGTIELAMLRFWGWGSWSNQLSIILVDVPEPLS